MIILHLKLKEPDSIEEEDDVKEEVTKQRWEDEGLAAQLVAERPRKQSEEDAGGALQHPVIRLDLTDILLSLLLQWKRREGCKLSGLTVTVIKINLDICVIEDVVTDGLRVVEVHFTSLLQIEILGSNSN